MNNMRTFLLDGNDKRYECNYCDEDFSGIDNIIDHLIAKRKKLSLL